MIVADHSSRNLADKVRQTHTPVLEVRRPPMNRLTKAAAKLGDRPSARTLKPADMLPTSRTGCRAAQRAWRQSVHGKSPQHM